MISIFLAEALVMIFLASCCSSLSWWQEAAVDAGLLSLILFPPLQIFFFKPLLAHVREKEKAEESLARAQRELESRVRERTADLLASHRQLEQEIVERCKIEQELSDAKEQWEDTFYTINDAITIHDRQFNIIRANRAAVGMLSITDALPAKCFSLYHGTACPPANCPSCTTLHTGKPMVSEVFEPHLNRYLEIKALARLNGDGEIIGVIHVVRDISERKKAEEEQRQLQAQLIQAQKMETIGRLAGGVAHDFNNILTVIMSYAGFALQEIPADSKLAKDLLEIKEAGERAAALTRQLLAFSRKQVLDFHVVDLNEIIDDMVKMIGRMIGENIILQVNLQDSIRSVAADPGQIEQIIMNLAVNARDAMPEGGHLIIESADIDLDETFVESHEGARTGSYAMFAVTDTGSGMPAETRAQVFEPFFTTKELGRGTGLGLSTVYGIVKQHNGYIYLYSEEGKGTTFKVYLPATTAEENSPRLERKDHIRHGTETILVAEDDKQVLRLLSALLEPLGYRLLVAVDGREAVRIAGDFREKIDILLTDVIMPGINGRELADRLQAERPEMKAIFMSGYTDEAIARFKILKEGELFIQKPLTPSILLKAIRTALDG